MINCTDYTTITFGEALAKIKSDFFQTTKTIISIETIQPSQYNASTVIRIWWRDQ
jgi:hypothetical protein